LLQAALAGVGIVVQPDALLEKSIADGSLVHLLPEWELPGREMHILRLPQARPSAKVRTFVDLVVARLGD
jgi:DNA-binding transcriptional LysR family regulator